MVPLSFVSGIPHKASGADPEASSAPNMQGANPCCVPHRAFGTDPKARFVPKFFPGTNPGLPHKAFGANPKAFIGANPTFVPGAHPGIPHLFGAEMQGPNPCREFGKVRITGVTKLQLH